jgi:hypothetical protein
LLLLRKLHAKEIGAKIIATKLVNFYFMIKCHVRFTALNGAKKPMNKEDKKMSLYWLRIATDAMYNAKVFAVTDPVLAAECSLVISQIEQLKVTTSNHKES